MATKVARMRQSTEERLHAAVGKVSELVGQGQHPNDAVCKIATDLGLNEGLTEQVIRAYNTGRQLYQYGVGSDANEKLASFPLADVAVILPPLSPAAVKPAAALPPEGVVSQHYDLPPKYLFDKIAVLERAEHATAVMNEVRKNTKLAAEPPKYEDAMHQRNLGLVLDGKRDAAMLKQAAIGAKYKAIDAFDKLGQYFRRGDALPYCSVLANAQLVYGDRAKKALEVAVAGDKLILSKTASAHAIDWTQAPYSLILDCFDKAAAAVEAEDIAATAEKTASQRSEAAGLRPFPEASETLPVITGSVLDAPSSNEKVAAGGLPLMPTIGGLSMGAALTNATRQLSSSLNDSREGAIKSQIAKLQDPVHEQSLRRIRTQAMLSDLLQHDPEISSYDEGSVADAFNRLSEVAPNAMQHGLITKALLRKYLAQGNLLEQFDMDQLLGLENKLHKPQVPQQQM